MEPLKYQHHLSVDLARKMRFFGDLPGAEKDDPMVPRVAMGMIGPVDASELQSFSHTRRTECLMSNYVVHLYNDNDGQCLRLIGHKGYKACPREIRNSWCGIEMHG